MAFHDLPAVLYVAAWKQDEIPALMQDAAVNGFPTALVAGSPYDIVDKNLTKRPVWKVDRSAPELKIAEMGLNGEVALKTGDVLVGYVSGESYGKKKNLRVTVEVRMEIQTRQREYETVEHAKIARPLEFSLTTAVWNTANTDYEAGGATVQPLRELVTLARGFVQPGITALIGLNKWHLSAMTAACAHQVVPPMPDTVKYPESSWWALKNTPPCPETGYKYGHTWLVRPLPAWLTPNYVRELLHLDPGPELAPHDIPVQLPFRDDESQGGAQI